MSGVPEAMRSYGAARVAAAQGLDLGEGVTWDPVRGEVVWVDITTGRIFFGSLEADGSVTVTRTVTVPGTAGAVAVAADGSLVVAGTHGVLYRAPNGTIAEGPRVSRTLGRRLNDGKADPAGRFLVGTLSDDLPPGSEVLVRIESDGSVTVLDDDLTLSNGLGWSTDGRLFYSVDTLSRRIFVRDYDPVSGRVGPRSLFAEIPAAAGGMPDGMTVDADDHLWVALWGAGRMVRIDPTGDVVGSLDVSAPQVSCVEFIGTDLATLAITTAREHLSPADLERYPLSGSLFTARPGVTGKPPNLWVGAPTAPGDRH